MNRLKGLWSRLRRITKINLIIGTIAALVFGYIAVTAYFGTASQVRYTSNDFPGAKKAASVFLHLSPVPTPHRLLQPRHRRGGRRRLRCRPGRPRSRAGDRSDLGRMRGADQPVLRL
jgi:hypothetical protein